MSYPKARISSVALDVLRQCTTRRRFVLGSNSFGVSAPLPGPPHPAVRGAVRVECEPRPFGAGEDSIRVSLYY